MRTQAAEGRDLRHHISTGVSILEEIPKARKIKLARKHPHPRCRGMTLEGRQDNRDYAMGDPRP